MRMRKQAGGQVGGQGKAWLGRQAHMGVHMHERAGRRAGRRMDRRGAAGKRADIGSGHGWAGGGKRERRRVFVSHAKARRGVRVGRAVAAASWSWKTTPRSGA